MMKSISIFAVVLFLASVLVVPSSARIDPATCVAAWLFDDGAGEVAQDASGNKSDGTLVNGPVWVDGKFGKALSFDGVDDYVNLPGITSTNWEGLTLVAWAWLEQLPNELPTSYDEILGSKADLYDMYEDRGNNELRVKVTTTSGAERPGIPTAQLQKGRWIHIAGIFDGAAGQMKIYLDGKLIDTHNLGGVVNGTQFPSIGAQGGPNGPFTDFHKGLIDEVALFSVALSEQDLQTVINEGLGRSLGIAAVAPLDKLPVVWAGIKSQ